MRTDMFKVIVERPRYNSRDRFSSMRHSRKMADYLEDSTASKHGMRRLATLASGYGRKQLNENLSPLLRFIAKHVGRPWDDVFSEICKEINSNSTVQKHVRDHIQDYVGVDYRYQSGYKAVRYGKYPFYVDENGILCTDYPDGSYFSYRNIREENKKKAQAQKDAKFRKIGDEEIWNIDGIWYSPVWKIANTYYSNNWGSIYIPVYDCFTKQKVNNGELYRAGKRQVDKKTLRKFGVCNFH